MRKYTVGVVGAMGAVGTQMLIMLERSALPLARVVPMDIKENEGKEVVFRGRALPVQAAEKGAFRQLDIALFSAGEKASLKLAPLAVEEGTVVIDNSNAFRMDPKVPLVVPEVNPQVAKSHNGIIANPNCSTIQMVVALKPLHDRFKIKRVVVSTYQAISGTGLAAITELDKQIRAYADGRKIDYSVYPHQIAFNAIPHIDTFLHNEYTKEEMKMVNETKKIMGDESILVSPTAVRIPVFRGHSESINIETEKPLPKLSEIEEIFSTSKGIIVVNNSSKNHYPMPIVCEGRPEVFVGRIRKDHTVPNGLNIWVVADNLLKGAALNAIQIAELLVGNKCLN